MSSKKLKIQVEYENFLETFEGDVDEVLSTLIQFLYKIYPQLELVSKITWNPNIENMLNTVSEFGKLTNDGHPIIVQPLPSAEQAVLITLTLAHIGQKIGNRTDDSLEVQEISKIINKAQKTVRNTLAELIKSGNIERIEKGLYKITSNGLMRIEETLTEAS